jgi:hypothetical protein
VESLISFLGKTASTLRLRGKRHADSVICLLFASVIILLYRHVLNGYWLYDDPYLLKNAASHSIWSFFFKPDTWQKVSLRNLTPWVILSYKVDYLLFGLDQHYFYLHHLISLWLVSIALYKLLRLWAGSFFAACGSLFFLVSAPVAASAEMLMTRHYIEGLFFCLVSFHLYVKSVREDSLVYSLLAAAAYFLSMSAKELYVPLAAVLFFLPEGKCRERAIRSAPSAAAMILYFAWRHYMLGDFIAGPQSGLFSSYGGRGSVELLLKNIHGTVTMMTGVSLSGEFLAHLLGTVLLLIVSFSFFTLLREKKYGWLFFHMCLVGAVYIIPLSVISPYYAAADFNLYRIVILVAVYIAAIAALCLQFLYKVSRLRGARTMSVAFSAGIAVTILVGSSVWIMNERKVTLGPLAAEGKFFMSAGDDYLLVKSNPLWAGTFYYQNLETFRKKRTGENSPLVVYGPFAFLDNPDALRSKGLRVVTYDAGIGVMKDITRSYMRRRNRFLSRLRVLPLTVGLRVDRGYLSYSLGQVKSGNYFMLAGYKSGIYCMKVPLGRAGGSMRLNTSLRVYVRIGRQSRQGWVTISPEWLLDFSKTREIKWSSR